MLSGPNLCSPLIPFFDWLSLTLGKSGRPVWGETKQAGTQTVHTKLSALCAEAIFYKITALYLSGTRLADRCHRRRCRQRVLRKPYGSRPILPIERTYYRQKGCRVRYKRQNHRRYCTVSESLHYHGRPEMNIRADDFVLEIGSGHNPKARSDVLCDKFIEDDEQRGGKIIADRPIVEADGQFLPFSDKAFDYVICSHVLEHVEDPRQLIAELMRVANRGYIETPSEIGERIYGWHYHNWVINLIDDRLVLQKNRKRPEFGQLFHTLAAKDKHWKRFHINASRSFPRPIRMGRRNRL